MEYEHGAENQPMDGNPSMRGPSESATQIARADCPTCRIQSGRLYKDWQQSLGRRP
ncbi:hypothetical protein PC123_g21431 [Phytophthora cactorum]|nr:hypothetical protein PC123_g21431 [Phytophthora cactorum]